MRVLVAMSGGVDSSVAVACLIREGYEVVGAYMKTGLMRTTLQAIAPGNRILKMLEPLPTF